MLTYFAYRTLFTQRFKSNLNKLILKSMSVLSKDHC